MSVSISKAKTWTIRATVLVAVLVVSVTYSRWWPALNALIDRSLNETRVTVSSQDEQNQSGHDHGGHDHSVHAHEGDGHSEHDHSEHEGHDHASHNETTALELSAQAMRSLGLVEDMLRPIALDTFHRSITVPATIIDKPGRTHRQVSAPFTGVVTRVAATEGEALLPGDLLFEMRVTHEDLVQAQTEYLKTLGELDVERKEVARLSEVTRSGAVAGRVLLERQYERDKLEAVLSAQREALLLHGLSGKQVDQIADKRRLLRTIEVYVPTPGSDTNDSFRLTQQPFQPVAFFDDTPTPQTLETINVQVGQSVETGVSLAVLADLSALYIEALAYEQDAATLADALNNGGKVTAVFDLPNGQHEFVEGLSIRFLDTQIDPETRTLSAYVELPNAVIRDRDESDGTRFVAWRYRPGQRLQLRVPIDRWSNRIVLPVDAVAREGAESFVFTRNGDHFDRVPVHVEYRDQFDVVVASDGAIVPGDIVARRGAHQMQMALKNKAGGGADPHAGHSH